jgi:hypothetical protein
VGVERRSANVAQLARRSLTALKGAPKNWILEKSRATNMAISWTVAALGVLGLIAPGLTLALIWGPGKIPMVVSGVAAWRRGEFSRWNRPQSYQKLTRLPNTLPGSRFRVLRALGRMSEIWDGWTRKSMVCALADAWINEQVRLPMFCVEVITAAALLGASLPFVLVFAAPIVIGEIPKVKSGLHALRAIPEVGWKVAARRFFRPGSFQRSGFVHTAETRRLTIEARLVRSAREHVFGTRPRPAVVAPSAPVPPIPALTLPLAKVAERPGANGHHNSDLVA